MVDDDTVEHHKDDFMHFVRVILACLRRRRDPEHAIPVMPCELDVGKNPHRR